METVEDVSEKDEETDQSSQTDADIHPVETRAGVDNKGTLYEDYIYQLLVFRLLEGNEVLDFYIAKNVKNVGNFDDIVLKVTYKENSEDKPITKFIFIQLKHKETVKLLPWNEILKKSSGEFCLNSYYSKYKSLKETIGKFQDPILNSCTEEDMILVLYTNTNFEFQRNTVSSDCTWRKLLETDASSTVFRFSDEEDLNKDLWDHLQNSNHGIYKDNDESKFIEKLVLFSGQSNQSQVNVILNEKLSMYIAGSLLTSADALERVLKFTKSKSQEWLNRNRGALHDINVNYQGVFGKMNKIFEKLKLDKSILNKIIVKNMYRDENSAYVQIGDNLKKSESYYIERKVKHKKKKMSLMLESSFVILSAPPGMGKTSFLANRAAVIKKKHPEKFIIWQKLVDHSKFFNEITISDENRKTIAENFLLQLAKVMPEETIEFDLFQHCLKGENKLVCFLDGVDEISPNYFNEILAIIQTIRKEFKVQLWVSTRPVTQRKLEEGLKEVSWKLDPFTWSDWNKFVKKYCGIENYKLGELAKNLRKIPLYCKMVGDIINSERPVSNTEMFSDILDQSQLYDKFTDVMYRVYYQNTDDTYCCSPAGQFVLDNTKRTIMENHEAASLLEILPPNVLEDLEWDIQDQCKNFFDDILKGVEKTGFILDVIDDKPKFMHRSIAEYFTGRWFAKNIKKFKRYSSKYDDLGKNVKYFMTLKLSETDEIFKKILTLQRCDLIQYLERNKEKFNMTDELGRNVLYYADLSCIAEVFKYIMNNGFELTEENVKTRTFKRGLHQSIFVGNILAKWLHSLISKSDNDLARLGLIMFAENTTTFEYYNRFVTQKETLHYSILNGDREKVEQVLNSADINGRNELGFSLLHISVFMNAVKVVKLLGERAADHNNTNTFGVFPRNCAILVNSDTTKETMRELDHSYKESASSLVPSSSTPLHSAVQQNGGKHELYNSLLAENGVDYLADKFGFYPHSYAKESEEVQLLMGFGFACSFQRLSKQDQFFLGVNVADIVRECDAKYFRKGFEAKLRGTPPYDEATHLPSNGTG